MQNEDIPLRKKFCKVSKWACLADELVARFQHIVMMDAGRSVPKSETLCTYGLGGCTAVYIDNGDTHALCHYSPLAELRLLSFLRQHIGDKTRRVVVFAAGDYVENAQDKWDMVTKVTPLVDLHLKMAQQKGVKTEVRGYSCMWMFGHTYQGTVWTEKDGALFHEGDPVDPQPAKALKPGEVDLTALIKDVIARFAKPKGAGV